MTSEARYQFFTDGWCRHRVEVPGQEFCSTLREAALAAKLSGLPVVAIRLVTASAKVRPGYTRIVYDAEEDGSLDDYLRTHVLKVKRRDQRRNSPKSA